MALLVEDGQAVGLQLDSLRGAIRITNITDSSVTAAIVGQGLRKATTGWNSYQSAAPNTITVQWYMDFHLRWYPWENFPACCLKTLWAPDGKRAGQSEKNDGKISPALFFHCITL
ncbi:MAG: hypothetical protein IPI68_14910 [Chitinophagaceae bacterium]|nr:hypothetical protein [Chitinophagaceae bacterium]